MKSTNLYDVSPRASTQRHAFLFNLPLVGTLSLHLRMAVAVRHRTSGHCTQAHQHVPAWGKEVMGWLHKVMRVIVSLSEVGRRLRPTTDYGTDVRALSRRLNELLLYKLPLRGPGDKHRSPVVCVLEASAAGTRLLRRHC